MDINICPHFTLSRVSGNPTILVVVTDMIYVERILLLGMIGQLIHTILG